MILHYVIFLETIWQLKPPRLFPNCDGEISFSVPTGNFGDILAGSGAQRQPRAHVEDRIPPFLRS